MTSNRYVKVTILRNTQAVSQAGFGTALILSGNKEVPYQLLQADTALSAISTAFGATSPEYNLASRVLGQSPRPSEIAIYGVLATGTDGASYVSALNDLILTHNDWYYLLCSNQTDAVIGALAEWTETQDKMYAASTSNKVLGDTLPFFNTFVQVHNNPLLYPAEGWVGVMAPQEIGTATWTFKTISGVTPVTFNNTEIADIEAKNGNTYIREGGVNITSYSKTLGGEWIDIIQTSHYLKARVTEAIFGLLVRLPKVPYTQAGLDLVEAEISAVLQRTPDGMLATDASGTKLYSVTMPDINTISTNDKADRFLRGVKFRATIAGAIENVDVIGTLEY